MKKILFLLVGALLILIIAMPAFGCAQRHVKVIKVGEHTQKGYLGVNIEDVTKRIIKKKNLPVEDGAYISSVVSNSPADEAGIEDGDVIVKFGDKNISDSDDLRNAIRGTKPKTDVTVELYRDGAKKTLMVKVGKLKSVSMESFNLFGDFFSRNHHFPKLPKIPKPHISVIMSETELQGLQVQELTKQLGEYFGVPDGKGVLVSEVEKESESAKAGFKAGDVITKIEDRSIYDTEDLRKCFDKFEGKDVAIEVVRSGKPATIKMKIEKNDDDEWDEE
jgi:serine protease Do